MNPLRQSTKHLWLALTALLFAAAAPAQSSPVYVAYNGSDSNACTRSAPCQTITHALSVVAAGGVVDIVASGTYDTFTITHAVSVEADPGVDAIINVAANGTGITISGGSSDTVVLRNLSVQGAASGVGIQANSAAKILVANCQSSAVSYGIFLDSTSTDFEITGGDFQGSDTSIIIRTASNEVSIDGVKTQGAGSNAAIDAVGTHITVTHSTLLGSGANPGIWVKGGSNVVLENDVVTGFAEGVVVGAGSPGNGTAFLSNNTISANSTGVDVAVGTAFTRGNNTIRQNTTNVSGSLTAISGQ